MSVPETPEHASRGNRLLNYGAASWGGFYIHKDMEGGEGARVAERGCHVGVIQVPEAKYLVGVHERMAAGTVSVANL